MYHGPLTDDDVSFAFFQIGMYNGTVAVYNVRSSSAEPVLDS